jgi:hypothetical protein
MRIDVPARDAPIRELWEFANTYHAYQRRGGLPEAQRVGLQAWQRWEQDRALPASLDEARTALFFQARAQHFGGDTAAEGVQDDTYEFVRALVQRINELSGGSVIADRHGAVFRLWHALTRRQA